MHRMPYKGFENAGERSYTQAFVNETPAPIGESPVNEKRVNPVKKMTGFTIAVRTAHSHLRSR